MPTKISNTNTNINKININVPRRYTPRATKKNVAKAEQELSQVENLDREIPYVSQAPSQFINPSVFGFNTTPIQERPQTISRGTQTEPMETQTEEMATSPRVAVAEAINRDTPTTPTSPISFRSSLAPERRDALTLGYSQPQYKLNIPSDFPSRLNQAEGSAFPSSGSSFKMPIYTNRMRDIQKQGRPDLDINQMAITVKEAYRGEEIPFAKKKGGGRPTGSKNKPKPVSEETQTGASLPNTPKPLKQRKTKTISVPVGVSTPKFEQSIATAGGLRGQRAIIAEEID
jgi:hypothetical protein